MKVNPYLIDKGMVEDLEDLEVKNIEGMQITKAQEEVIDKGIIIMTMGMSMIDTILTEKDTTDMSQDIETVDTMMTITMMMQIIIDHCHMAEEVPDLSIEQKVYLREISKTTAQIIILFIMIQDPHFITIESEDHSVILEIMDMNRVSILILVMIHTMKGKQLFLQQSSAEQLNLILDIQDQQVLRVTIVFQNCITTIW